MKNVEHIKLHSIPRMTKRRRRRLKGTDIKFTEFIKNTFCKNKKQLGIQISFIDTV